MSAVNTPRGLEQIIQLGQEHPLAPACERFYFLRHGQTACNARRIFQAVDEPLNAIGQEQARQATRVLAGESIARIVCSDARRAVETAYAVALPHGLVPEACGGLRERNFGELIGTSSAAIDWTCTPAGGETLAVFMQRSHAALSIVLASPGPVLVVAHGGTLYALAAMLSVHIDLRTLGNAQPLRFDRVAGGNPRWTLTPLLASSADSNAALA